jgi:protein involved in polysaccharide export with SLBB domain
MVRRPAIYELLGETSLADALELAGGILETAALRHVEVQRVEAHEKRTMLSLDLSTASGADSLAQQLRSFTIHDGDEIHIFPIAPYNEDALYLQGHVLRPGRYSYRAGMKLTDLVASYRDLLPEPAPHYVEIVRLNLPDYRPSVESFDLSAALAHPETAPTLQPLDTVRVFSRYDFEAAPTVIVSGEVRTPGRYRTSGEVHLRDAIYLAGGVTQDAALESTQLFRTQPDGTLKIVSVELRGALDGDPLQNLLLQPRDRVLVHRNLTKVDPPTVYVKGEVAKPGRYPLTTDMRVADLIRVAGGIKRSADTESADLTQYAASGGGERVEIRLAAAMSGSGNENAALRAGDLLTIRQIPGWNDIGASVTLGGEVRHPGVYGIRSGERLSSLLRRAGGLMPTAYPQAAVFERGTVRELQEKSRQDMIRRLEQETVTVKTSAASSGSEEAALQQAAMQQRERVLDGLRRAPVSGRLVLRLRPEQKGFANSADDIELRAGDSLAIPKQPGFVLISGQVYNSNAITFSPGKSVKWYLSRAGGATGLADKNAIFVVRASGMVASGGSGGLWSGGILSTTIMPGDTIVVPEKPTLGGNNWKNFIAIAQMAEAGAMSAAFILK